MKFQKTRQPTKLSASRHVLGWVWPVAGVLSHEVADKELLGSFAPLYRERSGYTAQCPGSRRPCKGRITEYNLAKYYFVLLAP